jgi:hypothetical protein
MNKRELYKRAETRLNFEDRNTFKKVEINGKIIAVPVPESLELFVKDKKLTEKGRWWTKYFYEEVLKTVPEDSNLEHIESNLKSALSALKESCPSQLYDLLNKSIRLRIERLKSIKYYEEIKASNSPFLELIDFLKSYYQKLDPFFVENFSLPVILKVKKEIYKIAESIKASYKDIIDDEQKFNLLISFIEKKFVETSKSLFVEKTEGEVKLKDVAETVMKELRNKEKELIWEFRGYLQKIPQLTTENITEISSSTVTPDSTTKRKGVLFRKIRDRLRKILGTLGLAAIISISSIFSSPIGTRPQPIETLPPKIKIVSDREIVDKTFEPENYDVETLLRSIKEPITEKIEIPKELLLRHSKERFLRLEPGETFYIEDLYRYIQILTKEVFEKKPDINELKKFVTTVRFLLSAKALNPQAIKFKLVENNGYLSLEAVDYLKNIEVKETIKGDVVIIGNELESIVGAISAAKQGKVVILVYDGPLGGLSSDKGGNMRYFDFVSSATITPEMRELFEALEMTKPGKQNVIPNGVEEKLLTLLQKYPNIKLIKTRTFNSILVRVENNKILSIKTEEGREIEAEKYIDSTPDGVLAIKAGVPFTIETLNLAYGAVFDLKHLTKTDLEKLGNIDIDEVLQISGVTLEEVIAHKELKTFYEELKNTPRGANVYKFYTRWGYQFLAKAFKFYLKAKALKNPSDLLLQKTAEETIVDGFNVAIRDSEIGYEATFNSLSFNSDKSYHQGDHNVLTDNDFLFQIVRRSLLEFEEFIKKLIGNHIEIRIPEELYVRGQTIAFNNLPLKGMLNSEGNAVFVYGWDVRGIRERYRGDETMKLYYDTLKYLENFSNRHRIEVKWKVSAFHTQLMENLFGVGKNFCNPDAAPTYRIIQNLMLVMEELVRNLDNEGYWGGRKILARKRTLLPEVIITISSSPEVKVEIEGSRIMFEIPFKLLFRTV